MTVSMIERLRIPATRLFAVSLLVFLCLSQSSWEETFPEISAILFCSGMVLVGVASLGRLWCGVYIAGWKNRVLITQGPYSMTRNPLYFFSAIGAAGIGLATETLTIPIILVVALAVYYPFVINKEERKLSELHGEAFEIYLSEVPKFWPNLRRFREPSSYTVNPVVLKQHLFSALWFVWIVGILEMIEELHELGWMNVVYKIF